MIEGIDINPNPIVIDTPRTREFLDLVNSYPHVQDDWYRKKLMYFIHHLRDHLGLEDEANVRTMSDKPTHELREYALKHPDEWEKISNRMDRHRTMMILAYASIREEWADMDEHHDEELVKCGAYQGIIGVDSIAVCDTIDTLLSVERLNRDQGRNVGSEKDAERIVDMTKAQTRNFNESQKQVIVGATKFFISRNKR